MAGVNVIVSGGGTIVASVDGGDSVNVEVAGGIGPAAVVNTSGVIVGVNPIVPSGGTNITVSGSTSAYTIHGPSDSYIAGRAPVQSVQGRAGNVVLTLSDITAAPLTHTHSTANIVGLTSTIQAFANVVSVQGRTGNVVLTLVDLTAAASSHTHTTTNITGFTAAAAAAAPVQSVAGRSGVVTLSTTDISGFTAAVQSFANVASVQGRTGSVVLTLVDLTAAASSHTHSTANITGLTAAFSVQGKTGNVVLTAGDLTAAPASHSHNYTLSVNEATGNLVLQAGANVSISRDQNTITISASNNNTAAVASVLWPAFILGG